MMEMDAIKFYTLYLEGNSHEWFYHGMTTLGHAKITSYAYFTKRLIDRFDQGDPKLHFHELTQLKQEGTGEEFIEEFQRLAVMVPDVSESRLMMLFFEGLTEPLHGWVKDFKPNTLQDAIWKTRDLEGEATKNKLTLRPPITQRGKDQRFVDKGKGKLDEATKMELRRKQLCYACKEPWDPRHIC
jgi:hypothetical protein